LFAALRYRPFALLWLGRTISSLGDGVFLVALAWFVLTTTGSASANGVILICETVPMLLLALIGGAMVDRASRRRLLLTSDIVRALVVAVIALLAWRSLLAFWQLALLSVVFGVVKAFFFPAYVSVIPQVTPSEALLSANSLASLSAQTTGIIGPALGGALVALGGTSLAFSLDALSFLVSAACVFAMPPVEPVATDLTAKRGSGMLGDIRAGLVTVLRSPWLWITIAIAGVSNITLSGPLEAALPLLARKGLHAGVGVYALLNALLAVGSVIAAVALGRMVKIRRRGVVMYGAWMLAGAALLCMGLPITVVGVGTAILICGAGLGVLNLVWANTLQEMVPGELLGRVSSVDGLGSYALLPLGYGLAGFAADHIGASTVFLVGGAASVIFIGLGLLHPATRGLD
jgi:DHA3 family tetracycline resistance protein-like MFS transporter